LVIWVKWEAFLFNSLDRDGNSGHWYVVHCKPSKEYSVSKALRETLGLTVYLPASPRLLRGKVQSAPYFPGYLFVRADLQQIAPSSINTFPGVVRLLRFGDRPQAVPESVVETIRGFLSDPAVQQGIPSHDFRPGDNVWLRSGPLRGLHAVFNGPMTPTTRVKVLLQFLGRLNEVEVDVTALAHAHNAPLVGERERTLRTRGTRGRGRRIKN